MKKYIIYAIAVLWIINMTACQSIEKKPDIYRPYLKQMPVSILILPPVNQSLDITAAYKYLSIISRPIAEKGYYVFPVAVIDALMKENGVSTPEDMHRISLSKIREIINPDAVLYVNIKEWGTKFKVIDSQTVIHISAQLIDTDTGNKIWGNESRVVRSSVNNNNSNDIVNIIVAAMVSQVISNFMDQTIDVANEVNRNLYYNAYHGLLWGKYHPLYEKNQKELMELKK